MNKHAVIYVRVSTSQQSSRSQVPDLPRWIEAYDLNEPIWYEDKATGKNMNRPGWQKLQTAIDRGKVNQLVV